MKKFGLALAAGVVLVFLHEMWGLVRALGASEGGVETGAIWAILLMIFAAIAVVGVIGGGLYRAIWRGGEDGPPPRETPGPGSRSDPG